MKPHALQLSICLTVAALPLGGCGAAPVQAAAHPEVDSSTHSRVALAHALPALDGARLAVTVMEVRYGPGGSSAPHRHSCPVVGYIIEGAYRSRVQGEAESTYTAGQSFYEAPNAVHLVSANASHERPVRFLALFTCDRESALSVEVPDSHHSAGSRP